MAIRSYSERLGMISDEQFQAALDRFNLGKFIQAEPIPSGLFGQNVFVSSTEGEYVLRGVPHFVWQFPTEQFYARQIHERTQVPVPWPYLIDPAQDIFGWSYVIMPRMQGLQLADPQVRGQLGEEDKRGIARAVGENLALLQELTWPFSGRYDATTDTVQPFELRYELAWPFPVQDIEKLDAVQPIQVSYRELVVARIRSMLARVHTYSKSTTDADIAWVESLISQARDALNDSFQPCIVMQDYKRDNLVVERVENIQSTWRVSGVFDLMQAYFGDGESDLSRATAMYLEEDPQLAREFIQAYTGKKPPRPGFAERFPIYMLDDRVIIWEYVQRMGQRWWNEKWTFRDWASQYIFMSITS